MKQKKSNKAKNVRQNQMDLGEIQPDDKVEGSLSREGLAFEGLSRR